ncbi:uncharacterized protein B0I36DRAFT_357389 [Microdochium trichocladiopsis]|uniref:RNA helicase n=1 Tax=Microdochium trichocladiopsis TaxID=1682393 RepID=A0A9P8YJ82_9PEZI|nr:uncharacterized protein B0I36DRAFT_357389 [Microdochium trichocladiopsis]KAH7040029.1 hypothetical protein B0I36DRAFT_357389 [Microdochium trichocladiopsis]
MAKSLEVERVRSQLSALAVDGITAEQIDAIEENPEVNPHTVNDKETRPYSAVYWETRQSRKGLPVYKQRQEFLDFYQKHQVMILSSGTGFGKTTQIPQFVFWAEYNRGA